MTAEPKRATVGTWLAVVSGAILAASLLAILLGALAVARLDDARTRLVDRVGPARTAELQLTNAYVDQETGVRGFLLTGKARVLEPAIAGRFEEAAARRALDSLIDEPELRGVRAQYEAMVAAAARWHREYADPAIAAVRTGGTSAATPRQIARGTALFDVVRARSDGLRRIFDAERNRARDRLDTATRDLKVFLAIAAALVLIAALAAALTLQRVVIRPLATLSATVRDVAAGAFSRRVESEGPREIATLADDVDAMRARIVDELAAITAAEEQLREQALELQRSNAELEQFAYVASHDLQEPLRKIVSFNQMLEQRYKGQLDERADQYIDFAIDGARRMQALINDLLAFSRVGRVGSRERVDVPLGELVDDACSALAVSIAETGARIEQGPLPVVHADRALLTVVLQNLIGNAVKFHGDEPPVVRIEAREVDGEHEISVSDNGIGIPAQYADRIFIIFQRLHPRSEYDGTGIGLAMCRKIIEHHGGRIWLDDTTKQGTTFRFTLPITEEAPAL